MIVDTDKGQLWPEKSLVGLTGEDAKASRFSVYKFCPRIRW